MAPVVLSLDLNGPDFAKKLLLSKDRIELAKLGQYTWYLYLNVNIREF